MSEQMEKKASIGKLLTTSKSIQFLEIFLLFIVAFVIIKTGLLFTGENPILKQGVVWLANVAMLILVWLGLKFRRQNWSHLGLSLIHFYTSR